MLRQLLAKLKRKPQPPVSVDVSDDLLSESVAAVLAPLPPRPKGRVIKQTRHSEFNPNPSRHGGRIVKVMPRQLQKIKAAQEKVENDEQPQIED